MNDAVKKPDTCKDCGASPCDCEKRNTWGHWYKMEGKKRIIVKAELGDPNMPQLAPSTGYYEED